MSKRLKTSEWGSGIMLALILFAAGCSGSEADPVANSEETAAGTEAVTSIAPTSPAEPTATAIPEPSATAVTEPTATPEPQATAIPERDLPLVEAEQVALEFAELVTELFADPRDMDISRMIQLEAGPDPVQPMTNWTLRVVNNLNSDNRYQPAEGVKVKLIGSQWDPEFPGQLAWVYLCSQTGGVWFDLDTDEQVMTSNPDPFISQYRILVDTMQIAAVTESPEDVDSLSCEFSGEES